MSALSEQEIQRRESLNELRKLGIDPYPAEAYEINANAKDILANYEREKTAYKNISIAGRIMTRRIMGNASFVELQDATGRLQVYIRRDDICPDEDKTLYNTVFKKLLDIGDFIGVKGYVFTSVYYVVLLLMAFWGLAEWTKKARQRNIEEHVFANQNTANLHL